MRRPTLVYVAKIFTGALRSVLAAACPLCQTPGLSSLRATGPATRKPMAWALRLSWLTAQRASQTHTGTAGTRLDPIHCPESKHPEIEWLPRDGSISADTLTA